MTLARGLALHAEYLLKNSALSGQPDADLRRAVSASYYSLFHRLTEDAASQIAPHVGTETNHRIRRWFNHAEMKQICGRFLATPLAQPLFGLIGEKTLDQLKLVCRSFIELQEARHSADYDLSFLLDFGKASDYVRTAVLAAFLWDNIRNTPEANIFILSLLMWKNWDRERA